MLSSDLTKKPSCNFFHNKNSLLASQQTSPLFCCHNISSTTHNTKIPIFINLQQTNTLTHLHIKCPTFSHFLLSTTKVVSSSIKASLKKKHPPTFILHHNLYQIQQNYIQSPPWNMKNETLWKNFNARSIWANHYSQPITCFFTITMGTV